MINFDFKHSLIYPAVFWLKSPIFYLIKFIFIISLVFFLVFLFLFWTSFALQHSSQYFFLAGFSILSLVVCLFSLLLWMFFQIKIKNPKVEHSLNLADFLSFETAQAIDYALKLARKLNLFPVSSSLLLYSLLFQKKTEFIFSRALINLSELAKNLLDNFYLKKEKFAQGVYSQEFLQIIQESYQLAKKKKHYKIEVGDVLSVLARLNSVFNEALIKADLHPQDIDNIIAWMEEEERKKRENRRFWEYRNLLKRGSLAKDWAAGYSITLDQYSIDWTRLIRLEGYPEIIGYEKEVKEVEAALASPEINNVMLVGVAGVGMKNVILKFAKKGALGQSLEPVNYKRVVELQMPKLLAQIKGVDEIERTLETIFKEVIAAGNIILVIDDFHNFVVDKERPGTIDITGILASYLDFPQFPLIAITTYEGLHRQIEKRPSLVNMFHKIEVKEPSPNETILMLQQMIPKLERKYKKFVSYPALKSIISLSSRYIATDPFPKKAKDLLEEVMVRASMDQGRWVLPEHVERLVSEKTEIPVGEVEKKEKEKLVNLEELIHRRIINQDEAVNEISNALRRAKAGMTIRNAPMGSFLFLGPTGVGKTETAKALAQIYFGSEKRMIRLDMSEFQNIDDIHRLLGTEDEEGILTVPVRENPFSLVLLDEIEKAHPIS